MEYIGKTLGEIAKESKAKIVSVQRGGAMRDGELRGATTTSYVAKNKGLVKGKDKKDDKIVETEMKYNSDFTIQKGDVVFVDGKTVMGNEESE